MSEPQKDRSDWVVRKFESFDEVRAFHVMKWQAQPFMKRLDAAWELVEEAWALKKWNSNELRLQRSVTAVVRRRG